MKKKDELISVVVPTYNASQFIVKALKSIFETNYPNFEVVIVDDCSTDNTVSLVQQKFGKRRNLKLIVNSEKKLAAGSRNRGVEESDGKYIALLDHDIEVDKDWLNELMAVFGKYNDLGVVQSRVLDISKRHIIQHAGLSVQAYLGWVIPLGFGLDSRKNCLEEKEVFANATGLMFKKSVWKKLGGFDEDLAINTDDWDFNWRCWLYGYKEMLAPKAITYHWSKTQKTRDFWMKRTAWEFHFAKVPYLFIKNYELKNLIIFLPVYLVVNFLRGIFNLIFRFNPAPIAALFLSLLWILAHSPSLLKKRHQVSDNRKITDDYLIEKIMDSRFIHHYFFGHWLSVVSIGKRISTRKPY